MIKSINSFPYQYKKVIMPKGLILNLPNSTRYNLIETKTGANVGKMFAYLDKDYNLFYQKKMPYLDVFYIDLLEINKTERNKGWGKYLIDFAKKESLRLRSCGRVTLVAYNPDKSPHLFYRKQGFKALSEIDNAKMDYCIDKQIKNRTWDILPMFLPTNKNKN